MKKYFIVGAISLLFPLSVYAQVIDIVAETTDCTVITHALRIGSRDSGTGGDVTALQTYLSQANYLDADPTGYFGRATYKAVQAFQKANDIVPLGNVGPYTRAKIKEVSCSLSQATDTTSTNGSTESVSASTKTVATGITTIDTVDFNNKSKIQTKTDSGSGLEYGVQPVVMGYAPFTVTFKVPQIHTGSLKYGDGQNSQDLKEGNFDSQMGYTLSGKEAKHTYAKPGVYTVTLYGMHPSGMKGEVTVDVRDRNNLSAQGPVSATTNVGTPKPSITILTPNGGEAVVRGTQEAIPFMVTWKSQGISSDAVVSVSLRSVETGKEYLLHAMAEYAPNTGDADKAKAKIILNTGKNEFFADTTVPLGKYVAVIRSGDVYQDASDLPFCLVSTSETASNQSCQETVTFKVFLGKMNDPSDPTGTLCPYAVARTVPYTKEVARAALVELFKGPTDSEKQQGYYKCFFMKDAAVKSINIENGVASVNLSKGYVQDCGGAASCSQTARNAVKNTLMQFPSVKSVKILIEGVLEGQGGYDA